MLHEMMSFFRLTKEFQDVDYFDTPESKKTFREIITLLETGNRIIALTGIVGSGKTTMCENIWKHAQQNRNIFISTSYSIEIDKVSVKSLERALFSDLASKKFKVARVNENREKQLCELIRKKNRPVALFVDEAHKLKINTLLCLKRLSELNRLWENKFSIVLCGLPKLATTLQDSKYEQIGARVRKISLDVIAGREKEFIEWIIEQCTSAKVKPNDLFTVPAIKLLAETLRTPLQIIYYSWSALEFAYKAGIKIVDVETVRKSLSPNINSLYSNLMRQGFSEKLLSEILDLKRSEIRKFLKGQLPDNKMIDINSKLLQLGIVDKAG